MLSVTLLFVVMLGVVLLNVVMLSVVSPLLQLDLLSWKFLLEANALAYFDKS